jgi:hypothetical protein
MSTRTTQARARVVAFALLAACGDDDPVRPPSGTLRILTTTGGESQDTDGYVLQVAGHADVALPSTGTTHVSGLAPGPTELVLGGIAPTCEANGGPSASATVIAGDTVTVPFTIACHTPP